MGKANFAVTSKMKNGRPSLSIGRVIRFFIAGKKLIEKLQAEREIPFWRA